MVLTLKFHSTLLPPKHSNINHSNHVNVCVWQIDSHSFITELPEKMSDNKYQLSDETKQKLEELEEQKRVALEVEKERQEIAR